MRAAGALDGSRTLGGTHNRLVATPQVPLLMQFGENDNFFDADEARKVAEQIKVNERPVTALQAGNFCSAGVPERQANTQMHAAECLRIRTALLSLPCSAWTFQLPRYIYIYI